MITIDYRRILLAVLFMHIDLCIIFTESTTSTECYKTTDVSSNITTSCTNCTCKCIPEVKFPCCLPLYAHVLILIAVIPEITVLVIVVVCSCKEGQPGVKSRCEISLYARIIILIVVIVEIIVLVFFSVWCLTACKCVCNCEVVSQ